MNKKRRISMSKKRRVSVIIFIAAAVAAIAAAAVFVAVRAGRTEPLICLDAGHGGKDTGAMTEDGRLEKDDNLRMTLAVGRILEEKGYRVVYTRTDDSTVSLEERYTLSNKKRATVFVAIHRNSAENAAASGIEAWIRNTSPAADKKLAQNILSRLDKVGFGIDRGISAGYRGDRTKNYAVNSGTNCKSCLLELGFMSNAADNERFDEAFDAYAEAIAQGIIQSL